MNHFLIHPDDIHFKPVRNFPYTFMDHCKEYYNILSFYDYLNHIDEHTLRNIYHHLVIRWSLIYKKLKNKLIKDKQYNTKQFPVYEKGIMNETEFNDLLCQFIGSNITLSIFVGNSMIQYFHPSK